MITTDRNMMIGAHATVKVKLALQDEAKKRKISVSRLLYIIMVEHLISCGHKLKGELEK